jgi:putative transposase
LYGFRNIVIKYLWSHIEVRSELKGIIGKIGYDCDIEIVELEIPVDHIHIVVRTDPKISPEYVMQVIKAYQPENFFVYAQR